MKTVSTSAKAGRDARCHQARFSQDLRKHWQSLRHLALNIPEAGPLQPLRALPMKAAAHRLPEVLGIIPHILLTSASEAHTLLVPSSLRPSAQDPWEFDQKGATARTATTAPPSPECVKVLEHPEQTEAPLQKGHHRLAQAAGDKPGVGKASLNRTA